MAHHHSAPGAEDALPAFHNSAERATLIGTLAHLWPYIWPHDRSDLKMRVVWSLVLLLIAKLATLSVPFTFKWAIDALTGVNTAPVEASNWIARCESHIIPVLRRLHLTDDRGEDSGRHMLMPIRPSLYCFTTLTRNFHS